MATKRPSQRSNDLFASSLEPDKREDDSDDLFSSSAKPPSNKPSPQVSRAKQPPAKTTPPASKKEASPKVTTKKTTKTGGLFGESDGSDDDLFSAPKPTKSTQPKAASKRSATKVGASDDLFSDDPFGATTKSQTKAKPATVKQAPPPPSDDLFTDPLATSPPPPSQDVKPKPTKKTAKPVERERDDDDDGDLFSDPLGGGSMQQPTSRGTKPKAVKPTADDDDLFSDNPLAAAAATKSLPPRRVDPARSKPKAKTKDSDDLFSSDDPLTSSLPSGTRAKPAPKAAKPHSDDLFDDPLATSPPPGTHPKPSRSKPAAVAGGDLFSDDPLPAPNTLPKPHKSKPPSEGDLFDDPLAGSFSPKTRPKPTKAESDDLFSDELPVEPSLKVEEVVPAKKKPAGAVSMFGGLDPFAAAAAARGKGGGGKSHDQKKPRLSTSPPLPSSEAEKKDNLFGKILDITYMYMYVNLDSSNMEGEKA